MYMCLLLSFFLLISHLKTCIYIEPSYSTVQYLYMVLNNMPVHVQLYTCIYVYVHVYVCKYMYIVPASCVHIHKYNVHVQYMYATYLLICGEVSIHSGGSVQEGITVVSQHSIRQLRGRQQFILYKIIHSVSISMNCVHVYMVCYFFLSFYI